MAKVKYIGGFDEAAVLLPSGDRCTVKRGGELDLLPSDIAHLSPTDWKGPGVGSAFDPPTPDPEPVAPVEEEK